MKNGRLIAFMGVTNVGKTTQRDLLVQYGKEQGINIDKVKKIKITINIDQDCWSEISSL